MTCPALPASALAPFKNAVGFDMLPPGLSYRARFQLAADAGFEAVEMPSVAHPQEAAAVRAAAADVGVKIHSVLTYERVQPGDPSTVREGVRAVLGALANARLWGADTVLLLPARVSAALSYREAATEAQAIIRSELLPAAAELGVILGIENVWDGCLLSPFEYVRYIDELDSPWVRAYLDVGNMILGYPEHWVRIAGPRIVKLHIKDFRLDLHHCRYSFGKIGEGAIDWTAVRAALLDVGFAGYITNTGVPRRRPTRWLDHVQRSGTALRFAAVTRALSLMRRVSDRRFLRDVSRRFEAFRAAPGVRSDATCRVGSHGEEKGG